MTYPRHPRPLIDLIPDARDNLDVSDEEDDFYGSDEDFLIPLKWQNRINSAAARVPRRVQRYFVTACAVAVLLVVSWSLFVRPHHVALRKELKAMDQTPENSYGSNARPDFKGMIQLKDLDRQHIPKRGRRLVFVGDVHGCREELEHLLHKINFKHKRDHLVLTGDVVAKGPDSPGVVTLMQKLDASCVRGNWEDKLLLSIAEAQQHRTPSLPVSSSSPDVLDEETLSHIDPKLRKLAKQLKKSHLEFLQQCPVILRVANMPSIGNLVVVHAGLVPGTPLESQDPYHAMNMRTIDLKTHIPSSKHAGTPWEKFWNHQQEKLAHEERTTVVYGHNRKRGLNIHEYTFGLDTGCVNGGRLTALVVDEEGNTEIVHVRCNKEKGYDEKED